MTSEYDKYEDVFGRLIEADKCIWNAVLKIQECNDKVLEEFIQPLMKLRGDIHVDFMRPMYKKYPSLATLHGFDDEK